MKFDTGFRIVMTFLSINGNKSSVHNKEKKCNGSEQLQVSQRGNLIITIGTKN